MSRNHCPNRSVLGILKRHGTFAQFLTLPIQNLHIVPDHVPNAVAVFAEPLAAACRVVEQNLVSRPKSDRIAILGDGKLGLMIAEVLGRFVVQENNGRHKPILFGKHQHKLDLVKDSGVECKLVTECQDESSTLTGGVSARHANKYDVVVDATGSPTGLTMAAGLCRPMGTLVLKSTCASGAHAFNAAPFVIDELTVVGSRCGPIDRALELLAITKQQQKDVNSNHDNEHDDSSAAGGGSAGTSIVSPLNVEKYITKTFPLSHAHDAIQCAAQKSTMKVQIICNEE